jgi:hypothetical protein
MAGIECAMMSYVVATNPFGIDADLETRCAIGGVVWAMYLRYLNGGNTSFSKAKVAAAQPAVQAPPSMLYKRLPWEQRNTSSVFNIIG